MLRETHEIERETCVRFVQHTNEVDFVDVINGSGCWSFIGRIEGRQEVSMEMPGCQWDGIMIHEWYHVLGYDHMHNHADRDHYVTIQWQNITPGAEAAFEKVDPDWFHNHDTPYDLQSIVHYDRISFSRNGEDTIVPRNMDYIDLMGRHRTQTPGDIQRINNMYEC